MEIKDIEELMEFFDNTGLTKMKYSSGSDTLLLEKRKEQIVMSAAPATAMLPASAQAAADHGEALPLAGDVVSAAGSVKGDDYLLAPMVGVFYQAPAPDAPPFVQVGEKVEKGQPLCILEAMKVMNEIHAEWDGILEAVLAEPEQIVEFGQPLFKIRRV